MVYTTLGSFKFDYCETIENNLVAQYDIYDFSKLRKLSIKINLDRGLVPDDFMSKEREQNISKKINKIEIIKKIFKDCSVEDCTHLSICMRDETGKSHKEIIGHPDYIVSNKFNESLFIEYKNVRDIILINQLSWFFTHNHCNFIILHLKKIYIEKNIK